MNKVILLGRLAADPDKRMTQTQKAVVTLRLAVNRRFSRNAQEGQPTADFFNIIVWERLAEVCHANLAKGSQIMVEGRLQTRSYDAQDGSKRYVTEVIATDIEFVGAKQQRDGGASHSGYDGYPSAPSQANHADSFGPDSHMTDEDIPF